MEFYWNSIGCLLEFYWNFIGWLNVSVASMDRCVSGVTDPLFHLPIGPSAPIHWPACPSAFRPFYCQSLLQGITLSFPCIKNSVISNKQGISHIALLRFSCLFDCQGLGQDAAPLCAVQHADVQGSRPFLVRPLTQIHMSLVKGR